MSQSETTEFDAALVLEHHLDIAARWSIRMAFEAWSEEAWEGYFPEVGQFDFERIIESAEQLLPADVTSEEWQKTYDYFADRAEELP